MGEIWYNLLSYLTYERFVRKQTYLDYVIQHTQKAWFERKLLQVYTNMPLYGRIFGMITTKDVAIVFSCLWCILCLGLTIIYVMLWQIKLGRLCWYWENRYKVNRFGDFIRQIERNIKRKIRRKDIITLHSNLFCLIESESWFYIIRFLRQLYELCHIARRVLYWKMLVQYFTLFRPL